MLSATHNHTYVPSPTFSLVHNDDTFVRAIMGPVGSGKTTGLCLEVLNRAFQQEPHNGVRRSRWLFIRNTRPELESTTIKTWQEWVPNEICPIVYSTPIRGRFRTALRDNTVVDCEVYFLAVNDKDDIKKLKSIEFTGIVINEASELPDGILDWIRNRVGRYPRKIDGEFEGATWSGVLMDTNPPKEGHWFHTLFEVTRPKGHVLYKQPPGLLQDKDGEYYPNPNAENLRNLKGGSDYYMNGVAGANDNYIKVALCGEYGAVHTGKRVHPNYDADRHRLNVEVSPARSGTLYVGLDWGLHPAAVIGQLVAGKLVILDELSPQDCSLKTFLDVHLLPLLRSKYQAYRIMVCGDPSGKNRHANAEGDSFSLCAERGLRVYEAPTNAFMPRKEAVDFFLDRHAGFVMSKSCQLLHDALNGGYKYPKNSDERPSKTGSDSEYTHIVDALQYLCLMLLKGVRRKRGRGRGSPRAHEFV